MYDLVIRGGLIVDGTGAPAREGDVALDGDRIAAVGPVSTAGTREIPIAPLLGTMLARWQVICPEGEDVPRVFPTLGKIESVNHKRRGRPLSYINFRNSYWRPAFERLGLPYVTPHSARHTFISTLQAKGIEVGLVAKLAGHANANITLAHYTQAVRGGDAAVRALEDAYVPAALAASAEQPALPEPQAS